MCSLLSICTAHAHQMLAPAISADDNESSVAANSQENLRCTCSAYADSMQDRLMLVRSFPGSTDLCTFRICRTGALHMLNVCQSCDISVNGDQMCGAHVADQPAVCVVHMLRMTSLIRISSVVICVRPTRVQVSTFRTHAAHQLSICSQKCWKHHQYNNC